MHLVSDRMPVAVPQSLLIRGTSWSDAWPAHTPSLFQHRRWVRYILTVSP